MSIPGNPDPAKLIISLLMNDRSIKDALVPKLEKYFGPLDFISDWFEFNYTEYYSREMGSPLFRKVAVFKDLIEQERLADIKTITNQVEKMWEKKGNRALNIDPGYMLLSRFILATGKDFSHRIYVGKGIYADLTLMYQKGQFKALGWTYPDYASDEMTEFLQRARDKYVLDLKREKNK